MYKISRIYVGNCGVNVSWYDGMILDFNGVDTGEPVDSIINLENGGGKSILLSLIFSCFETKKDRFLKHLHDTKNRFYQYFSHDGLPGIVAVEWVSSDGHGESKMVTGQVVSRRNLPGSEDVDRHFFSFVCGQNLGLESIPGPKLGPLVARSMPEVLQWFQSLKGGKNLFYTTKNHTDWERHLEKERGLDLSILKLQLEFSRAEGGVDSGFLTFKNDFDFLRMFFELTLDEERVQNVRESISITCEKLHRKPEYESRVEGLDRLLEAVTVFKTAGDRLAECEDEIFALRREATITGRLLRRASENLADKLAITESAHATCKTERDMAGEDLILQEKVLSAYRALALYQKVQESEQCLADAQTLQINQTRALRILHAALKLGEIRSKENVLTGLKEQRDAIEAGLEDLRQPTVNAGTAYTIALVAHKNQNAQLLEGLKVREGEIQKESAEVQETIAALNEKANELNRTQGTLQTKIELYNRERSALAADGLLSGSEDKADVAISRFTSELALKQQNLSKAEAQKSEAAKEIKALTEEIADTKASLDKLERDLESVQRQIGDAEAMRNNIQNLPILEYVVNGEASAELDETLLRNLDAFADELNHKTANNSVALAEIATERISLDTRQLSHPGLEIEIVVGELHSLGIKTARSFAGYLADTVPDAIRARQLIVNNPAKYLGVCVQTEDELTRARQVLSRQLDLKRPVMVSLVDDTFSPAEYGFVLPAKSDVQFNYSAAEQFAKELAELECVYQDFRKECAEQIDQCHKAKNELARYLDNYGEGRIDQFIEQRNNYLAQRSLVIEQLAASRHSLERLNQHFEIAGATIIELSAKTVVLDTKLQRLRRFKDLFECDAAENQNALDLLTTQIKEVSEVLQRAEIRRTKLNSELVEGRGQLENRINVGRDYTSKIATIEYRDDALVESATTDHILNYDMALEDLEDAYRRALDLLKNESGARLGVIDAQLTEVGQTTRNLQKSFDTEYDDLALTEIEAELHSDIASRRSDLESLLTETEARVKEIIGTHAAAQALLNQYKAQNKIRDVVKFAQDKLATDELESSSQFLEQRVVELLKTLDEKQAELLKLEESLTALAAKITELETGKQRFAMLLDRLEDLDQLDDFVDNSEDSSIAIADDATFEASVIDKVGQKLKKIGEAQKAAGNKRATCEKTANNGFDRLKDAAHSEQLRTHEREISDQITMANFEQALRSRLAWTESAQERLAVTRDLLASMRADFNQSVEEFIALIDVAIKKLLSAATTKKMPDSAPYVGGKTVIKIRANSLQQSIDIKRQKVGEVLDQLIAAGKAPDTGPALVARAVLEIGGNSLSLHLLKFVVDPSEQYVPISKLSNSGAEAVAMAMSLYFVIAQLRAESKLTQKNVTSGPLILDNPFAKATNATLWEAQRSLAKAMGAQLIFATGLRDYNTISQFGRVLCLRRSGKDKHTERWHIELSDYELLGQ